VVAESTPDPAVLASAVAAAEQRGLEHLRQVMFSGEDLDPISRDDSDLDGDGLLMTGQTPQKNRKNTSRNLQNHYRM
jgi:hypothetical protein